MRRESNSRSKWAVSPGEVEAHLVGGRKTELRVVDQPVTHALHDPRDRAAHLDRVHAHRVHKVIQLFGRALIEDAALRAERLIRFVVLLVDPVVLLARDAARLAAVREVLRLDDLLVELLQVVLPDEGGVLGQARFLRLVHRAPVEAEQPGIHGVHVDAESAAGLEAGHVAVLLAHAQVHLDHRLAVVGHEVAVDLLGILQIGIFPVAAEDARGDAVALEQPAAQPAAAGPVIDGRYAAVLHLVAADDPLIGVSGSRPYGEDTHPISIILGPIAIQDGLLQRVETDQIVALVCLGRRLIRRAAPAARKQARHTPSRWRPGRAVRGAR